MFVWWGSGLVNLYNDASIPVHGQRHPDALGSPASWVWSDIWDVVGPQCEAVMGRGQASWNEEQILVMSRNGFNEETYFTFSYSPVPDEGGRIGGVLGVCTDETNKVLGRRRLRTLRELAAGTAGGARSAEEACRTAATTLNENPRDLPFALIYLLDDEGRYARLTGLVGLDESGQTFPVAAPEVVDLQGPDDPWPLRLAAEQGRAAEVAEPIGGLGTRPGPAWPEPTRRAVVLPGPASPDRPASSSPA
jgi:PAS domain-containing protein